MPAARSAIERFHEKYEIAPSGCWRWLDALARNGYAKLFVLRPDGGHELVYAHRFSHETFIGPIPNGYDIDHLCRNRACVNPAHLEAVTRKENVARGLGANRTHCPRGHELDGDNVIVDGDSRRCRVCRNQWQQDKRADPIRGPIIRERDRLRSRRRRAGVGR